MSIVKGLGQQTWVERRSAAPIFVGGYATLLERLTDYLTFLRDGADITKAPSWLQEPEGAERCFRQVGSLSLIERGADGSVVLTALGTEWLASPDPGDLFCIFHYDLIFIGEMLAMLTGGGLTPDEILQRANTDFLIGWEGKDQVRRRLAWMRATGVAAEGASYRHTITEFGQQVLGSLAIETPASIRRTLNTDQLLQAAPPLIRDLIDRTAVDQSARRRVLSYIPKDPVRSVLRVVQAAAADIPMDTLEANIADILGISTSSADAAVATVRMLGLLEYTGKDIVAATPIGLEWAQTGDPLNLVRIMHARLQGVGETLRHADQLTSSGDVHRALWPAVDGKTPVHPNRTARIMRILEQAGALTEISWGKFIISTLGRQLASELPMMETNAPAVTPGDPAPAAVDVDRWLRLAEEVVAASTDAQHPARFENAIADAFEMLGVNARHIGGAGNTDVLVTITAGLNGSERAIIDGKSAAGGLVSVNAVSMEVLVDHQDKHDARLAAVIGPEFEPRLYGWAERNGVTLITAEQLANIILSHRTTPFTPTQIAAMLSDGPETLDDIITAEQRLLRLVALIMEVLHKETTRADGEPLSARDLFLAIRDVDGVNTHKDEITGILRFLTNPMLRVLVEQSGGYMLTERRDTSGLRMQALASAVTGQQPQAR